MARKGFATEEPVRGLLGQVTSNHCLNLFFSPLSSPLVFFTAASHNCSFHLKAVVSTGQNKNPYPQVSNPHSEVACLSPGKLQSLTEPRQLYPRPAPSWLLQKSCISLLPPPKKAHLNLRHPFPSLHKLLLPSQQKFCPPALAQHTPVPHALWGYVFRAVGHVAQVGHSPEPPTDVAQLRALVKLACTLPQECLDGLLQSFNCRPSYNRQDCKKKKEPRNIPEGQTLPLQKHCPQVVFLPIAVRGGKEGGPTGTMNFRWSGPVQ